jgi:hypothetical protein
MSFVEQLSAVTLLVDFLFGVTFGVIGSAAHGSRREDRQHTLLGTAPGPLSAGARVVHGLYTRSDEYMRSLLARDGEAASAGERGNQRTDTEQQEVGR